MANGDDTLYTYTGDASSVLESLDEISSGLDTLLQKIQEVADAAAQLASLEDALAGVADALSGLGGAALDATTEVDAIATASDSATEALVTLGSVGEDLTTIGTDAETSASQIEGLNSVIDQLGGTIAEDTSIIDGLNGQVANLTAQLDALTATEAQTTEADAALGAAKEDTATKTQSLGESLQAAQGPLLMIAGAGIMAGKSFFDMGSKAEDSLNQVQALAGVAPQAMAQYTNQLEAQGVQFSETLDQEAQGLYYVTSAGFSNAGAMKVLAQSVEDAKSGHIDLSIAANGLTTVLNAYGASADQATQYNDIMVTAVTQGKQTFGDFASSIAKAAVEGNAAHISFQQVAAAESALTDQGLSARQASMDLASMMKAMDANADATAASAAKMGLSFDESSYKTMDLSHQMQYLQQITGGNQTEISKLTGGSAGLQAFNALMTVGADGSSKFAQTLDAMQHSTGAAANAFQTSQETISSHMDKLGAVFSILSYKVVEAIGPHLIPIIDGFSSAIGALSDFMTSHIDIMLPVLGGLAAMFGSILVAALAAFLVPLVTAAAPFLAIAAGIGVVVAGVALLVTHWQQVTATIGGNPVFKEIWNLLQQIGAFLVSAFTPVWQQLVATFQTQLVPAWNDLVKSLQPAIPAFEFIGAIIGGLLVVALGLLIAVIGGLVKAFAGALSGIIQAVGGIVQIISGALQVILGIVGFFVDLFTGHFDRLGADLGTIWGGIVTMLRGVWNVIAGVFSGAIGLVVGFVSGFVGTIIGYFVNLNAMLGGAISGVIGSIASWFGGIFAAIGGFFVGVWDGIVNGLKAAWDTIINVVRTAVLVLLAVMFAPIIAIGALFIWLYNHNYYFKALIDTIVNVVKAGLAWLQSAWETSINWLVGKWQWLAGVAAAAWNSVSSTVMGAVNTLVGWLASIWDMQIKLLGDAWGTLSGLAQQAWDAVTGVFGAVWGTISGILSGLWNNFSNWFGGLASQALQWGENVLTGFINGIKNKLGDLGNMLGNAASQIAQFLGFHSPTEEGEGRYADQWPVNFMNLFIAGIESRQAALKKTLQDTAQILGDSLSTQASTQITASISSLAPNPSTLPSVPSGQGLLGGNNQIVALLAQILAAQQQAGRQQITPPTSNTLGALTQQYNQNTFNGVQDTSALYNALNALQGLQNEYAGRGAAFNY